MPDELINENPKVDLTGLHLYRLIRGNPTENHGWGEKFDYPTPPRPRNLAIQCSALWRGDIATHRSKSDGTLVDLPPSRNPVFKFRKHPFEIDGATIMRNLVLKSQVVFGTVNASKEDFTSAIDRLGRLMQKWPDAVGSLITRRWPLAEVYACSRTRGRGSSTWRASTRTASCGSDVRLYESE